MKKEVKFISVEFRHQYLATLLVNLPAFIFGIVIGWTGGNLIVLGSNETTLRSGPITTEQASWISSMVSFTAIGSVLFFGFLQEKLGRKITILIIGIPQTLSWICMAFATNVSHLYISRMLSGFAGGGVFIIIPIYIAEISDKNIRGQLCSSFSVICNIGIFTEFILAKYLTINVAGMITAIISIGFMIGFSFMPETPPYLISRLKLSEAEESFKFFRGYTKDMKLSIEHSMEFEELKDIASTCDANKSRISELLRHIIKPQSMKAIAMTFILMSFPIMSGCFVLITFNQQIFQATGTTFLSAFWSSLIFAFIQILGAIATTKLVDNTGRRVLLISSAFASAFCLAIFGAFSYLYNNSYDVSDYTWIPIATLSVEVFVSSVGIIPVPNFMASELLDQKMRAFVCTMCSFWGWSMGFLVIRFYFDVERAFGMHSVMWFFTLTCCFCGLFTLFVLPETKGQNIENIAKSIGKKKNESLK